MQISLPPELEARLAEEAARRGLDPNGFVESMVIDRLSFIAANRASLQLIDEWRRDGVAEADPEVIRQRRAEAQEFFRNLAIDRGYTQADADAFAVASVANP